jgi:hypothetical protein
VVRIHERAKEEGNNKKLGGDMKKMKERALVIGIVSMVILMVVLSLTAGIGIAGQGEGDKAQKGQEYPSSDLTDYGDMVEVFREPVNGIPEYDVNGCEILVSAIDGSAICMEYDNDSGHCSIPEGAPVTEVSFGRLNVVRAPPEVLESGFDEAINAINEATYITLDAGGRLLLTRPAVDADGVAYEYVKAIDSPRENLALYNKLMLDGHLEGNLGDDPYAHVGDPQADPVLRPVLDVPHFSDVTGGTMLHLLDDGDALTQDDFMSAASFLAAGADKPGHITVDLVFYMDTILGLNTKDEYGAYVTYVNFDPMTYARENVYTKDVYVLVPELDAGGNWVFGHWIQDYVWLMSSEYSGYLGSNPDVFTWDPEDPVWQPATDDIGGFAQASDDALRVIAYTHDNEIPPAP